MPSEDEIAQYIAARQAMEQQPLTLEQQYPIPQYRNEPAPPQPV